MPRHEHGHFVAVAALCTQPLVVEEVAHTIGRRLEDDDGVGLGQHSAQHRPHHVFRVVHCAAGPEGHLGQVGHCQVEPAHGILAARRPADDQTVAATQLLHVSAAFIVGKLQLLLLVLEVIGIVAQQQAVHLFDGTRRVVLVATDHTVPARVQHQLEPGHIHLHQRRAAPLAGLEQNHADGLTGQTLLLQHGQQSPLWRVQHQADVLAAELVLDGGTRCRPIFKVVPDAHLASSIGWQSGVVWTLGQQRVWQPLVAQSCARTACPQARHRVVWQLQRAVAPSVLGNDLCDVFHGQGFGAQSYRAPCLRSTPFCSMSAPTRRWHTAG